MNWPCSVDQIKAVIKAEMKKDNYAEITIDDLTKVLYEKTGWGFGQLKKWSSCVSRGVARRTDSS